MLWLLLACISDKDSGTAVEDVADSGSSSQTIDRPTVPLSDMMAHLTNLDTIAQDNSNNRALGTEGAEQTQAYLKQTLEDLGYRVWTEPFTLTFFRNNADPIVQYEEQDFSAATFVYSAAGDVTAQYTSVDVQIPPGSAANSSTSGCETEDFAEFPSGHIAVIQRGTCTFDTKVSNATAAGASGVVIFNEGQSGRTGVVEGMLEETGSTIPVVGVSFSTGEQLVLEQAEAAEIRLVVDAELSPVDTENIFAELPEVDSNDFVLVGAHMDSVVAGPGINDNGSGSAMLLSIAKWLAENPQESKSAVRFAWWSAEELGLLGSQEYVDTSEDLASIKYYLNFDMVSSPNYVRFIYDGNGDQYGLEGPPGSGEIERAFEEHFDAVGLQFTGTPFDGRSDYGPFIQAGIPAGGLFTGAEAVMTEDQARDYGGRSGLAYDACYHQACDTLDNVNQTALQEMADAALNVTLALTESEARRPARQQQTPVVLDFKGEWLLR